MQNLNIYERAKYSTLTSEEVLEALAELVAWREMRDNVCRDLDGPEEVGRYVTDLEEAVGGCNNEDHARFDDYKEFFEDCIYALPKDWPCAEPWDMNLREVITEAIAKGEED